MRAKHWSATSYIPPIRNEPTTLAGALTQNGTSNLVVHGTTLNQLTHTGQGWHSLLDAKEKGLTNRLVSVCWGQNTSGWLEGTGSERTWQAAVVAARWDGRDKFPEAMPPQKAVLFLMWSIKGFIFSFQMNIHFMPHFELIILYSWNKSLKAFRPSKVFVMKSG